MIYPMCQQFVGQMVEWSGRNDSQAHGTSAYESYGRCRKLKPYDIMTRMLARIFNEDNLEVFNHSITYPQNKQSSLMHVMSKQLLAKIDEAAVGNQACVRIGRFDDWVDRIEPLLPVSPNLSRQSNHQPAKRCRGWVN
jgi:hypothetical protein